MTTSIGLTSSLIMFQWPPGAAERFNGVKFQITVRFIFLQMSRTLVNIYSRQGVMTLLISWNMAILMHRTGLIKKEVKGFLSEVVNILRPYTLDGKVTTTKNRGHLKVKGKYASGTRSFSLATTPSDCKWKLCSKTLLKRFINTEILGNSTAWYSIFCKQCSPFTCKNESGGNLFFLFLK